MIDKTDYAILRELQADSRQSWVDLARRTNLSASACQRRVQALCDSGVIAGFGVRINPEALGYEVEAYVAVNVERQDVASAQHFRDAIRQYPEVLTCDMMSGQVDYLLRVVAPDLKSFGRFIEEKLLSLPAVKDASSTIVLDPVKSESLGLSQQQA